jgi:hypothetical protein
MAASFWSSVGAAAAAVVAGATLGGTVGVVATAHAAVADADRNPARRLAIMVSM